MIGRDKCLYGGITNTHIKPETHGNRYIGKVIKWSNTVEHQFPLIYDERGFDD
jgi:hypothetical protein